MLAGLTKGDEGREREVERNVAGVVGSSPPPPLLALRGLTHFFLLIQPFPVGFL